MATIQSAASPGGSTTGSETGFSHVMTTEIDLDQYSHLGEKTFKRLEEVCSGMIGCRDAPIPIPGIGIDWIGSKKGVSVSVVEHKTGIGSSGISIRS